jgi:hypothetical protein
LINEPIVIVSQALAQRMFPNQDAVNRHVYWTDPVLHIIILTIEGIEIAAGNERQATQKIRER